MKAKWMGAGDWRQGRDDFYPKKEVDMNEGTL